MAQVILNDGRLIAGELKAAGSVVDVSNALAQELISAGLASAFTPRPSTHKGAYRNGRALKIASIGDSLVANGLATSTGVVNDTSQGAVAWAARLAGRRVFEMVNAGVGGQFTSQIADRFREDIIENPSGMPDLAFIQCGLNDIYNYPSSGAPDDSIAARTIRNNIRRMWQESQDAGFGAILSTIPVQGVTGGVRAAANWSAARNAKQQVLNDLIRAECENFSGLFLHDWYAVSVDPASTTGDFPANTYSYDGQHPSNLSCYLAGKELKRVLEPVLPILPTLPSSQSDNYTTSNASSNIHDNPLLITATGGSLSGTPSGTAAAGLTISNAAGTPTIVASVVARADGYGNNQRVVVTPGAANDSCQIQSADYSARFTNGEILIGECEVSVATPGNLHAVALFVNTTVGGVSWSYRDGVYLVAANQFALPENCTMHFRTRPLKIPPGAISSSRLIVVAYFRASGTATTVEVGRMQLRKRAAAYE